ncbi:MAG TPA: hypothetical protein VGB92_23400 [Longimicrobium sp.]|jgi:hypothetical protein
MTSIFLFFAIALHGGSAGDAFQARPSSQQSVCPTQTAQGLRVMDVFTNSDRYAPVKRQHRLRTSPRISGVKDAATCQRLRAVLTARAQAAGSSVAAAPGVQFYEDANYYYVVIPAPPSRCTPSRDHACLSTRWQAVQVFDRQFTFIVGAAV